MPLLTLNQAAKEAGKSKQTILDAIRNGRLSAPKDEQGRYQIDPAELFRVYPVTGQQTSQRQDAETGTDHPRPDTGVVSPNRRNLSNPSKSATIPSQFPPKQHLGQSVAAFHGRRSVRGNAGAAKPLVKFA